MHTFDLRFSGAQQELLEVCGRPNTVATHCLITRDEKQLRVTVEADDPDMLNLISTISRPGADKFLYEEDCVQIAVALPGAGTHPDMLLANPHGSRNGSATAQTWPVKTHRHALGWTISVDVPLSQGVSHLGLSVHRFYRGANHEVHGFDQALPHPLNPAQFAVVIVGGEGDAQEMAAGYRKSAEETAAGKLEKTLAEARKRMADAREKGGSTPSLEKAAELARARVHVPIPAQAGEGFLCWNEAYYLLALIDLWELTGKREWLEMAIPRMKTVWSLKEEQRGIRDSMRNELLPTWINDTETGTACTLVSGAILNPIARLLRVVHETPQLSDLWDRVKEWIPLCEKVINLHDPEWVEFPDGSGMHLEPYQKGPRRVYPKGGSRINPLNREFALGMPMLNIAQVTGNDEYLRKVTMMARFFKNTSEITDDRFVWEYLVGACPAQGEDISHAHIQVHFAELCCRDGIVFTEEDLRKMAGTLEKNIFRYGDVPCNTVRGYYPELGLAVGVWSSLCRFVPDVFPKIIAVVETFMRENNPLFREGWGIRSLTCIEKARRRQRESPHCHAMPHGVEAAPTFLTLNVRAASAPRSKSPFRTASTEDLPPAESDAGSNLQLTVN